MTRGPHGRTASRATALRDVAWLVANDVELHGATVRVEIDGLPARSVATVVSLLLHAPLRPGGRATVRPAPGVTVTLNPRFRCLG